MKEALTPGDIAKFLIGRTDAIRKVASSSSAIWTGVALTFLTAFARNYDQTFIAEKPFLWFFGPLLFSVVSGTWLYFICYTLCARRHFPPDEPYNDDRWRGFMGTFWMTAPIAWLYAIPVERFFDSVGAAHANVSLLTIVSIWRVLLMGKVLGVVTNVPFPRALMWVVVGASVEVFVITFIGGTLANAIGRGMMGMRNSPEEEILLNAMSNAAGIAFLGFVIAAIVLALWRWNGLATTWPGVRKTSMPLLSLVITAFFWTALAIPNQIQLQRNVRLEKLVDNREWRGAIDYMSTEGRGHFAPARPLPPKLYERMLITEVFGLAGQLEASDPDWIQEHLRTGLERVSEHLIERNRPRDGEDTETVAFLLRAILNNRFTADDGLNLFRSADPPPVVTEWKTKNTNFLRALRVHAEHQSTNANKYLEETKAWKQLADTLDAAGITNTTYELPR